MYLWTPVPCRQRSCFATDPVTVESACALGSWLRCCQVACACSLLPSSPSRLLSLPHNPHSEICANHCSGGVPHTTSYVRERAQMPYTGSNLYMFSFVPFDSNIITMTNPWPFSACPCFPIPKTPTGSREQAGVEAEEAEAEVEHPESQECERRGPCHWEPRKTCPLCLDLP